MPSIIIFSISLIVLAVLLFMKRLEEKTGKKGVVSRVGQRLDPIVDRFLEKIILTATKIGSDFHQFAIHHLPSKTVPFFARLREWRESGRAKLLKNFRGEFDLKNKGSTSLFLSQISSSSNSQRGRR